MRSPLPSARDFVGLALALVLGCASQPAPAPARPAADAPAAPAGQAPPERVELPEAPPRPPADPTGGWRDDSQGPVLTLVYVTRQGSKEDSKPAALVFSSDPDNPHFRRKPTATINVKRLYREQMAHLLAALEAEGLDDLPWAAQDYDATIGPERALYLFGEGTRRRVLKEGLAAAPLSAFTRVEKLLIDVTIADRW